MKKLSFSISGLFLCFACIGISNHAQAQLWNKIKNEAKNRAENNVIRKSGDATDAAIDKTGKKIDNSVNGNGSSQSEPNENAADNTMANVSSKSVAANYKSYDFVPGDKIIFQPDMSQEADAELPARFVLKKGNAEIQSYEGEKILHLNKGGYVIVAPLMSTDDYLPDQFTVEFDMMYENDRHDYFASVNNILVRFLGQGNENFEGYGLYEFNIISNNRTSLGGHSASGQNVNETLKKALNTNNVWHHVAIYVRKNIAKAYINEYRTNATNTLPTSATKLAIVTDGLYGMKIKNMRIAAGGDDKYNKIVTDGKFVTHGILFDVNKSTIKSESMGALNEIAKLMKDHNDLKFEINGHTDSDGNSDANMKLSQSRADAVKSQLISMGIDESRLETKGLGATEPIDKNDSAEGKANNRRVEFVKI